MLLYYEDHKNKMWEIFAAEMQFHHQDLAG
jgi:hypothetical protein